MYQFDIEIESQINKTLNNVHIIQNLEYVRI